jgi:hypothetical protein
MDLLLLGGAQVMRQQPVLQGAWAGLTCHQSVLQQLQRPLLGKRQQMLLNGGKSSCMWRQPGAAKCVLSSHQPQTAQEEGWDEKLAGFGTCGCLLRPVGQRALNDWGPGNAFRVFRQIRQW